MTVTIKGGSKLQEFLNQAKSMQKSHVDIGFFPESKYSDGTQVAEVAIYNEHGTESKDGKRRIPPRPFLLPTYNENKKKWLEVFKKEILKQIKENKNLDVKRALGRVGATGQRDVQEKIDWWAAQGQPRNADATVEIKGFNTPLIWNKIMYQSVKFKVR